MTIKRGGLKALACCDHILRASSASGKNSWSTIIADDDEWLSRKAIVDAFRRMFIGFNTDPDIGTPKCASYSAGTFGAITATCFQFHVIHI